MPHCNQALFGCVSLGANVSSFCFSLLLHGPEGGRKIFQILFPPFFLHYNWGKLWARLAGLVPVCCHQCQSTFGPPSWRHVTNTLLNHLELVIPFTEHCPAPCLLKPAEHPFKLTTLCKCLLLLSCSWLLCEEELFQLAIVASLDNRLPKPWHQRRCTSRRKRSSCHQQQNAQNLGKRSHISPSCDPAVASPQRIPLREAIALACCWSAGTSLVGM